MRHDADSWLNSFAEDPTAAVQRVAELDIAELTSLLYQVAQNYTYVNQLPPRHALMVATLTRPDLHTGLLLSLVSFLRPGFGGFEQACLALIRYERINETVEHHLFQRVPAAGPLLAPAASWLYPAAVHLADTDADGQNYSPKTVVRTLRATLTDPTSAQVAATLGLSWTGTTNELIATARGILM